MGSARHITNPRRCRAHRPRSRTFGVILAAGEGRRVRDLRVPKQFARFGGRRLYEYSLDTFARCPSIDGLLVVVPARWVGRIQRETQHMRGRRPVEVIAGGATRQDSSFLAVQRFAKQGNVAIVAIHDAARPFVTTATIERCIRAARRYGASVAATPATDTVIEVVGSRVRAIPDRAAFLQSQTPQTFRLSLIWAAHQRARAEHFTATTDDIRLVLRLGRAVHVVRTSASNAKVTTDADLPATRTLLGTPTRPAHQRRGGR